MEQYICEVGVRLEVQRAWRRGAGEGEAGGKGFKQREVIDFFETFAPPPAASCFRVLRAIACELGLDLCHFDADQAFVQLTLEEDVFMRLPQGGNVR